MFGLDDAEVRRRRQYVSYVRKEIQVGSFTLFQLSGLSPQASTFLHTSTGTLAIFIFLTQCQYWSFSSFASLEHERFGLWFTSGTWWPATLQVRYARPLHNCTCWPRFTILSAVWRRSSICLGETRTTGQHIYLRIHPSACLLHYFGVCI